MKVQIKDVYNQFDGRISVGPLGSFKHALFCKVPDHGQTIITDYESLRTLRDELSKYLNVVRPMVIPQELCNTINAKSEQHRKELFNLNFLLEAMTADRDSEIEHKNLARYHRDLKEQQIKELESKLNDANMIKSQWRSLAHKHEQTILDLKYRIVELENPVAVVSE